MAHEETMRLATCETCSHFRMCWLAGQVEKRVGGVLELLHGSPMHGDQQTVVHILESAWIVTANGCSEFKLDPTAECSPHHEFTVRTFKLDLQTGRIS